MFCSAVEIMERTEMADIGMGLDPLRGANQIIDQGLVPLHDHDQKGKQCYFY